MNFQQLEYIIAVDQHKHFGKAAEQCNITQATLSAMIKKLEEELNVRIFDRKKQPIITTETGTEVIKIGKTIILQRDKLLLTNLQEDLALQGKLTLGIIPTISNTLLPLLLPKLLKQFPNLELHIEEITTEEIIKKLELNQLDLGILATPLENNILIEEILYYEAMMVYGLKDSKKNYVSTSDLKDNKIWLLEEGNCFRNQSITLCDIQENQEEASQVKLESSSFNTLINLSDQFGGLTLIPELHYQTLSTAKKKKAKLFSKPMPVREVSIVYSRPYAHKNSILKLAEIIRSIVPQKLHTSTLKAKDLSIIGI